MGVIKLVGPKNLIKNYIVLGYQLPRFAFKSPIIKASDQNFDIFPES